MTGGRPERATHPAPRPRAKPQARVASHLSIQTYNPTILNHTQKQTTQLPDPKLPGLGPPQLKHQGPPWTQGRHPGAPSPTGTPGPGAQSNNQSNPQAPPCTLLFPAAGATAQPVMGQASPTWARPAALMPSSRSENTQEPEPAPETRQARGTISPTVKGQRSLGKCQAAATPSGGD